MRTNLWKLRCRPSRSLALGVATSVGACLILLGAQRSRGGGAHCDAKNMEYTKKIGKSSTAPSRETGAFNRAVLTLNRQGSIAWCQLMPLGFNYGFSKKVIFPHTIDLPHRTPTELVGLGGHFWRCHPQRNRRKGIVIAKQNTNQPHPCGDSNGNERIQPSSVAHIEAHLSHHGWRPLRPRKRGSAPSFYSL